MLLKLNELQKPGGKSSDQDKSQGHIKVKDKGGLGYTANPKQ